jgi:hypothetical protein
MNIKLQLRHAGLASLVVGVAAAGCSSAGTVIPDATQTTAEAIYVTPFLVDVTQQPRRGRDMHTI